MKVEQDVMAYGVEKDNAGCYFIEDEIILRKPEKIENNKEFCDCSFRWKFTENDAHGVTPCLSDRCKKRVSEGSVYRRKCGKDPV